MAAPRLLGFQGLDQNHEPSKLPLFVLYSALCALLEPIQLTKTLFQHRLCQSREAPHVWNPHSNLEGYWRNGQDPGVGEDFPVFCRSWEGQQQMPSVVQWITLRVWKMGV